MELYDNEYELFKNGNKIGKSMDVMKDVEENRKTETWISNENEKTV